MLFKFLKISYVLLYGIEVNGSRILFHTFCEKFKWLRCLVQYEKESARALFQTIRVHLRLLELLSMTLFSSLFHKFVHLIACNNGNDKV